MSLSEPAGRVSLGMVLRGKSLTFLSHPALTAESLPREQFIHGAKNSEALPFLRLLLGTNMSPDSTLGIPLIA